MSLKMKGWRAKWGAWLGAKERGMARALLRFALMRVERVKEDERWVVAAPKDGESFGDWRQRASTSVVAMGNKARADIRRETFKTRAWVRAIWGVGFGVLMGWFLTWAAGRVLSGSSLEELGAEVDTQWAFEFWASCREVEKMGSSQCRARSDRSLPLPRESDRGRSGKRGWAWSAAEAGAWVLAFPLAPLGWALALGIQPLLASRGWAALGRGLSSAGSRMGKVDIESAMEGWLDACRWMEVAGAPASAMKVKALECYSRSCPGLHLGLVMDSDAGWHGAAGVADEARRRHEVESGVGRKAAALIMGSALAQAFYASDARRREMSKLSLSCLSRWWEGNLSPWAPSEAWRRSEIAKGAAALMWSRSEHGSLMQAEMSREVGSGLDSEAAAEAPAPWASLEALGLVAKAWDGEQGWPESLRKAVVASLASDAALLAMHSERGAGAWSAELSAKKVKGWAVAAWSALDGWGLDSKELAVALFDGLSRDPIWRERIFGMGANSAQLLRQLEQGVHEEFTAWEAKQVGRASSGTKASGSSKRL